MKGECYYASVTVDFSAPASVSTFSNSIVPNFLPDGNHFTPAFIIPRDQYYRANSNFEKEKFEERALKAQKLAQDSMPAQTQKIDISPPVPSNSYCQICKCGFTCYETHLKESYHMRQSKFSKANTYISQLCRKYSQKRSSTFVKIKNKPINKKQIKKGCQRTVEQVKKIQAPPTNFKVEKCMSFSTNPPSLVPTP